jgi:hypothetical protein
MAVAPGHALLPTIKILHHDKLLAPGQLLPRHCAGAHLPTFSYRDSLPATYQLCTATLVMLNKICTITAKTRAIPSLHRDSFLAKVQGPCPVLASGNTTSLYCRAVRFHSSRAILMTESSSNKSLSGSILGTLVRIFNPVNT